jgi:predicted transposase/invertase (TIGR01784 family)
MAEETSVTNWEKQFVKEEEVKQYTPKNNLIFEMLFNNAEYPDISLGLVKTLIPELRDLVEWHLTTPYDFQTFRRKYTEAPNEVRYIINDYVGKFADGTTTIVEMQNAITKDSGERFESGVARVYARQIHEEEKNGHVFTDYSNVRNTFGIIITNDEFVKNSVDAVNRFSVRNERSGTPFPGTYHMKWVTLDLSRMAEDIDVQALEVFLKTGNVIPGAPEFIQQADKLLEKHKMNQEEATIVASIEENLGYQISREKTVREEGREQGREEGCEKKAEEIALELIEMNLPIEKIAQATKLSLEKIEILIEKRKKETI